MQVDVYSPMAGAGLVVPMNGVLGVAPTLRVRRGPLVPGPLAFLSCLSLAFLSKGLTPLSTPNLCRLLERGAESLDCSL